MAGILLNQSCRRLRRETPSTGPLLCGETGCGTQKTMKTGYLIDMDGVIYRENHLICGAAAFVEALVTTNTPFLFLTNNSAPTPDDLAVRLAHLGIKGLSARHFYTSAMNTADFLSEMDPGCTAFVLGEGGIHSAMHERKIPNDAINPRYVVVGEGLTTSERLGRAHEYIDRGARLLATNPDNWCPVSADRTRPGAGATTAFLEASTGRRAYFLGKPNGYMFHRARRKVSQLALLELERFVMIGDTMETDIRGALEADMQAYLVLTGSTPLESVNEYVYQPTRVLASVADLTDEILTGTPSNRLNSPVILENAAKARGVSPSRATIPLARIAGDISATLLIGAAPC